MADLWLLFTLSFWKGEKWEIVRPISGSLFSLPLTASCSWDSHIREEMRKRWCRVLLVGEETACSFSLPLFTIISPKEREIKEESFFNFFSFHPLWLWFHLRLFPMDFLSPLLISSFHLPLSSFHLLFLLFGVWGEKCGVRERLKSKKREERNPKEKQANTSHKSEGKWIASYRNK